MASDLWMSSKLQSSTIALTMAFLSRARLAVAVCVTVGCAAMLAYVISLPPKTGSKKSDELRIRSAAQNLVRNVALNVERTGHKDKDGSSEAEAIAEWSSLFRTEMSRPFFTERCGRARLFVPKSPAVWNQLATTDQPIVIVQCLGVETGLPFILSLPLDQTTSPLLTDQELSAFLGTSLYVAINGP